MMGGREGTDHVHEVALGPVVQFEQWPQVDDDRVDLVHWRWSCEAMV
jgi:hypothetical protein